MLLTSAVSLALAVAVPPSPAVAAASISPGASQPLLYGLQRAATEAYAKRDFAAALTSLNELVKLQPSSAQWRELRAMTLVDGKSFTDALRDFDECLALLGPEPSLDRARVLSGRGLAWEGIGDWVSALNDYTAALDTAAKVGADPDPYILNSRGNCHASLGEWKQAREDYLASANGFQSARREDGAGSLQQRLDGAVFAFSNAALMLAQVGDDAGAVKEMQSVARRAPGSADMRVALAAMLWATGQEDEAEAEWEFACTKITVGCVKYQDADWVQRIRRWPPVMAARLEAFLKLRSAEAAGRGAERAPRRISGFRE